LFRYIIKTNFEILTHTQTHVHAQLELFCQNLTWFFFVHLYYRSLLQLRQVEMCTANCIISEPELTQQYEQASGSEVANLPCGGVYIPLGSQPLAQSYIRYIHVTRASCPKTPCKCMTITPRECMPKTPRHPHHITCSSRLNSPQSPHVRMLTTLNLFIYASLWMVQTHLYLPQRSN